MAVSPIASASLALFALILFPSGRLPAAQAPAVREAAEAPTNDGIRVELLALARDDQGDIRAVQASRPSDAGDAFLLERSRQVHERNNARIRQIVAEHGWPGKTLVGVDGAHAAWLLVQHADTDRPFQRRCLDLMRQAFEAGEVAGQDLAYLTDRVLVAEGQPQMYGTQGLALLSPEDEARVDANRLALGLEPLKVFREKRRHP